jgi:hypothetical protein
MAGYQAASILLAFAFLIPANFYVSVWLVRKNDSMVGGMPKATHAYFSGFLIITLAYLCIAASVLLSDHYVLLIAVGLLSILLGQLTMALAIREVVQAIAMGDLRSR